VTLYGSAPDYRYIRSGGREGSPMGCGGTCPICRPMAAERDRRRTTGWARNPDAEDERDPRYSWLPP
jgi:hypothetical protein